MTSSQQITTGLSTPPDYELVTTSSRNGGGGNTNHHDPDMITRGDVTAGGIFLLVLSLASLLINVYLLFLAGKNWRKLRKSSYFNTNVLCLVLAVADLGLALLVALPAGVHMTWVDLFRQVDGMMFHSKYTGFVIFEYLFLLRIVLLAVLTTDRAVNFVRSVNHTRMDTTSGQIKYGMLAVVVFLPLLARAVPNIMFLVTNNGNILCKHYIDNTVGLTDMNRTKSQIVPLTCNAVGGRAEATAELVIVATFTTLSWILITISNTAILLTTLRRGVYKSAMHAKNQDKARKMRRKLQFYVVIISVTFFITNFPYVCIWLADYVHSYMHFSRDARINPVTRFYLTLLIFLSLLFDPWLYLLKMLPVKSVWPCNCRKEEPKPNRAKQHYSIV